MTLEIYVAVRLFLVGTPKTTTWLGGFGRVFSIEVARPMSLFVLDAATIVQAAIWVDSLAQFIPFSLASLLVIGGSVYTYSEDMSSRWCVQGSSITTEGCTRALPYSTVRPKATESAESMNVDSPLAPTLSWSLAHSSCTSWSVPCPPIRMRTLFLFDIGHLWHTQTGKTATLFSISVPQPQKIKTLVQSNPRTVLPPTSPRVHSPCSLQRATSSRSKFSTLSDSSARPLLFKLALYHPAVIAPRFSWLSTMLSQGHRQQAPDVRARASSVRISSA